MSSGSRAVFAAVLAAAGAVVIYGVVYLPYLSAASEEARARAGASRGRASGAPRGGSTWANVGAQRDFIARDRDKPREPQAQ